MVFIAINKFRMLYNQNILAKTIQLMLKSWHFILKILLNNSYTNSESLSDYPTQE